MSTARPRIALVRHGATEWALNGRHTGSTDIPLTAAGEQQARQAGHRIALLGLRDPLVLTSPRSRATRTAELAGLEKATAWDALAEWDYGRYEGLTTPEIRESVPGWTVWSHPCPGGESAESVAARADMVLSTALSQLEERDVILVGHAHFSRALLARWAELPVTEGRRFAMDPAAISVLGFDHGVQQINTHNVTC
ncbi:acid phosphatase [Rhodococcus oryzae]|uniref:Acid phosphatase n=1 Tax=Rhodococcus oryzae TaxID=2571143 RepID=A0ABY2RSS2_9NOCA|nr:acid phosphatase [Rhodococcus oryzae]TJZ81450.1 acid phosphatase [Rhodococcus oryzae]